MFVVVTTFYTLDGMKSILLPKFVFFRSRLRLSLKNTNLLFYCFICFLRGVALRIITYPPPLAIDSSLRGASIPDGAGRLIVVDGVFSICGDLADLPSICALAKKYGAAVMVDDAHALGIVGDGGRGTASHFGLVNDVDIIMGTFSKSLASLGGFAAGRRDVIDYLRHSSSPFVFSAAITPASAATALAALRYLRSHPELPERLRGVSDFARSAFLARGIPLVESSKNGIAPILSIPTGGTMETCVAAKKMFDGGVFVNPFVPPGVPEDIRSSARVLWRLILLNLSRRRRM